MPHLSDLLNHAHAACTGAFTAKLVLSAQARAEFPSFFAKWVLRFVLIYVPFFHSLEPSTFPIQQMQRRIIKKALAYFQREYGSFVLLTLLWVAVTKGAPRLV